jgi:uncharacterized Zn finger protein
MERKTNPDFHLICGKCGCGTMFSYKVVKDGNELKDGKIVPAVFLTCGNCSTLTGLDSAAEDKTDWDKLKNI